MARSLASGAGFLHVWAMLSTYPRPWRIVRENRLFKVLDANGRIIGVFWFQPGYVGMQDQYPSEEEAREAAQEFAKLSRL